MRAGWVVDERYGMITRSLSLVVEERTAVRVQELTAGTAVSAGEPAAAAAGAAERARLALGTRRLSSHEQHMPGGLG
jgi:hypothetical protein